MQTEILSILEDRLKVHLGLHERRLASLSQQVNEQLLLSSRLSLQLNQLEELSIGMKRGEHEWNSFLQNSENERRNWETRLATLAQQLREALVREAARDQEFLQMKTWLQQLASAWSLFNEQQKELEKSVSDLSERLEQ